MEWGLPIMIAIGIFLLGIWTGERIIRKRMYKSMIRIHNLFKVCILNLENLEKNIYSSNPDINHREVLKIRGTLEGITDVLNRLVQKITGG